VPYRRAPRSKRAAPRLSTMRSAISGAPRGRSCETGRDRRLTSRARTATGEVFGRESTTVVNAMSPIAS
jgi:hypothetical protein